MKNSLLDLDTYPLFRILYWTSIPILYSLSSTGPRYLSSIHYPLLDLDTYSLFRILDWTSIPILYSWRIVYWTSIPILYSGSSTLPRYLCFIQVPRLDLDRYSLFRILNSVYWTSISILYSRSSTGPRSLSSIQDPRCSIAILSLGSSTQSPGLRSLSSIQDPLLYLDLYPLFIILYWTLIAFTL